jgi:hypothetical protein
MTHEIASFNKDERRGLYWIASHKSRAQAFLKTLKPKQLIILFHDMPENTITQTPHQPTRVD